MKNSKVIRLDPACVQLLDEIRKLRDSKIGDLLKKYSIPENPDTSYILAGLCLLKEKYLEQEDL